MQTARIGVTHGGEVSRSTAQARQHGMGRVCIPSHPILSHPIGIQDVSGFSSYSFRKVPQSIMNHILPHPITYKLSHITGMAHTLGRLVIQRSSWDPGREDLPCSLACLLACLRLPVSRKPGWLG
ncbi:hypothetical protein L211DRAFT_691175 [Terfezia boudieri ATCC MYA-4762]|uniref:Uncharacterized protein n=1 Tax=Terfezia boudieri ATCC MYA-4762 TaxID=1051890 RepID=A0A3N4LLC2_9PEZI|nr:hypothetical protein L211DRAFT_691175 [Terfezia boudieri ATCC MYA-4762]